MPLTLHSDNQVLELASGAVEYGIQGTGPTVLYFHGTGAGNEVVFPIERPLLESGFQLLVPNRPGYYRTPLNDRRSTDSCAEMAAQLLDARGIEKIAVIGTSGGGPPAARFAAQFPARTACLILQCSQSHRWDAGKWLPQGMRWARPLFCSQFLRPFLRAHNLRLCRKMLKHPRACLQKYTGDRFGDVQDDAALQELIPLLLEASLECAKQADGIENDWDILLSDGCLKPGTVHVPTLIIHDRLDPLVPFAHAEWSAASIAGAELCEFITAGHFIWYGAESQRMHDRRVAFLREHLSGV